MTSVMNRSVCPGVCVGGGGQGIVQSKLNFFFSPWRNPLMRAETSVGTSRVY